MYQQNPYATGPWQGEGIIRSARQVRHEGWAQITAAETSNGKKLWGATMVVGATAAEVITRLAPVANAGLNWISEKSADYLVNALADRHYIPEHTKPAVTAVTKRVLKTTFALTAGIPALG